MHLRHQNIPIEILRTVVEISATGSLSKAAANLGLSQPAVSSQIKRIEMIVGGSIFCRSANGSIPTALGKLVIVNARKVLVANEQILALGGALSGPPVVRVGLSSLLVRKFMARQTAHEMRDLQIVSDNSPAIAKLLLDGKIDIACIFENTHSNDVSAAVVETFEEPLIWARSIDFVLSPGLPIPIITWPGDDWTATALTKHCISYRVAFNGEDVDAKLSAVEAGLGVMTLPEQLLPRSLACANEYYLPKLPPVKFLLCIRPDFLSERTAQLRDSILNIFLISGPRAGIT